MYLHRLTPLFCAVFLVFAATAPAVAADDGAKTFDEVCGACHTPKKQPLDKAHLTKDQWKEAIERMGGYGAEVAKGKMADLLEYLVRTRGPASSDTGKK